MVQKTDDAAARLGTRQEYPEDRFDRIPRSSRVGAHRVTARPRYVWQFLIAALLGFALLTTLGILWVHNIGNAGRLPVIGPTATSAPPEAPKPELDPEATVAVLNGTETQNLAAALDQIIREEGWGQILFSGAAASEVQISAVFYADPADASAAEGLAAELGGLSTYVSTDYQDYGARLIVLLGADYAGPGLEEAEQMTEGSTEPPTDVPTDQPAVDPSTGLPIDPVTGYPIDPATGWPIDPTTGYPIDPSTGLPTDPATGLPVEPQG